MPISEHLTVIYDVNDSRARAAYERLKRTGKAANDDLIKGAEKAERASKGLGDEAERTGRRIKAANTGAANSFNGLRFGALKAVAAITAIIAAGNKLVKTSDSYTTIENRLRSIGEASDEAAEKLLAAAIRSRSPIESMSTALARIEKATGAGFDATLRRVETLNKLLSVSGSQASEVSSVMTQLSQALSSGVLQGDEFRSLRENAPIELMEELASVMGVTRGELKKLGSEGQITTAVMIEALDNLAATADEKFGQTTQTVGQAFTNIQSAATVFIGRLNEGLGATEAFTTGLQDLSLWLSVNAGEAEEFGRSVQAAFSTADAYIDPVYEALLGLASQIGLVTDDIFGIGEAFAEGGVTATDVIVGIIDALGTFSGVMEGSAAAVRTAFLNIVDAVSAGMQGAINAVITAIEFMLNKISDGINKVITGLNNAFGVDLGPVGGVTLERVEDLATDLGGSVADAYSEGFDRAKGQTLAAGNEIIRNVTYTLDGVVRTYKAKRAELEAENARREAAIEAGVTPDPVDPDSGTGTGSGRKAKGGRGRAGREDKPFFEDLEKDIQKLEQQAQLIGRTTEEVATLEAKWKLLDEAKRRGIPINAELESQIDAQTQKFGQLTAALERAEMQQKEYDEGIDEIADAMSAVVFEGESMREALNGIFKGIAQDLLKSGIHQLLKNLFPQGSSGGGILGIIGGAFTGSLDSFEGGGFTGYGPRSGGVDGRGGRLGVIHPNEVVTDLTKSSGRSRPMSINVNVRGANGDKQIMAMVQQGVSRGLSDYDEALPGRVRQVNADNSQRYE